MNNFESYRPGEIISSADSNRFAHLIKNGLIQHASGIAALLRGKIDLDDLSDTLMAFIVGFNRSVRDLFNPPSVSNTLSFAPLANSEMIYVDGDLKFPNVDYTISGTTLTFLAPATGGVTAQAHYLTGPITDPFVVGSYTLGFSDIPDMQPLPDGNFFIYGNTGTVIAKFRSTDCTQIVPPLVSVDSVDVSSSDADAGAMCRTPGYIWAIGSPSGGGTNQITRINEQDLTSTVFDVTADVGASVSSIATDGSYIYAFVRGGTYVSSNSVVKMSLSGTSVGVMTSQLSVTGPTDMIVSNNGFIYVACGDVSQKKILKFDTTPGNGLLNTITLSHAPTRLLAVNTDVYVLNGTNLNIISTLDDTVLLAQNYGFTPTEIAFDGTHLWISNNDTLYKTDLNGIILNTVVPQSGITIDHIMSAFGFVWTSFEGDSSLNITKVFKGIV